MGLLPFRKIWEVVDTTLTPAKAGRTPAKNSAWGRINDQIYCLCRARGLTLAESRIARAAQVLTDEGHNPFSLEDITIELEDAERAEIIIALRGLLAARMIKKVSRGRLPRSLFEILPPSQWKTKLRPIKGDLWDGCSEKEWQRRLTTFDLASEDDYVSEDFDV